MKKHFGSILIIILACGSGLSISPGTDRSAEQAVVDEIIALEKASFKAWQHKDKKFYSEYWADDFTEFLPGSTNLTTDPRANLLPKLEQSFDDWNLVDLQMHDPKVQLYGN